MSPRHRGLNVVPRNFSLAVAIFTLLSGCGPSHESASILDASQPATLVLKSQAAKGVFALDVSGTGHVDGTGRIELMLNGQPYKTEVMTGDATFRWAGDWYSPEATVRYTPQDARGGAIKLDYRFRSL